MDVKIEKKKGIRGIKPRQWAYIAAGVCAVAVVTWLATSDMASTYKVDRATLNIAEATDGQFDDFVRVDGRVLPISTVQVSPEEGGIVREKVVEEGAKVRKGDVIIRLSNSNLDLQILNAEAELAEKQNILRNTQISMEQDRLNNRTEQAQLALEVTRKHRAYQQQKRLFDEKLIAKEEYLQAKEDYELALRRQQLIEQRLDKDSIFRLSQVDQMEDNLANMQRNVTLIRERKDHLNIVSPIDGELGLLDVELGQNISAACAPASTPPSSAAARITTCACARSSPKCARASSASSSYSPTPTPTTYAPARPITSTCNWDSRPRLCLFHVEHSTPLPEANGFLSSTPTARKPTAAQYASDARIRATTRCSKASSPASAS